MSRLRRVCVCVCVQGGCSHGMEDVESSSNNGREEAAMREEGEETEKRGVRMQATEVCWDGMSAMSLTMLTVNAGDSRSNGEEWSIGG